MTRSFKHKPGGGVASGSNKWFKKFEHKAERTIIKQLLIADRYDNYYHPKQYGNEWASPRDGKQYWEFPSEREKRCWYLDGKTEERINRWYKWMRK